MAKKQKLQDPLRKEKMIIGGVLVALLLAVIGFITYYVSSNNYFLKIDGKKEAETEDFQIKFMEAASMYMQFGIDITEQVDESGATYMDYIKEDALNSIIQTKITRLEAEKAGITLTKEQEESFDEDLESLKESYGEEVIEDLQLTDEDFKDMLTESYLNENMFEEVTKDYKRDEKAFAEHFDEYVEENKDSLADIEVEYIDGDSVAGVKAAEAKIEDGEDFEEVYKSYSLSFAELDEEEQEEFKLEAAPLSSLALEEDDLAAINDLEEGETYVAAPSEGQPYFIRVVSHEDADMDELEKEQGEAFDEDKKSEMFAEAFEKWQESYDIDVNESKYNAMGMQQQ